MFEYVVDFAAAKNMLNLNTVRMFLVYSSYQEALAFAYRRTSFNF